MTDKPKTDGDHFRAINAAMDATWEAVKAAREAGLKVHVQMEIEPDSKEPHWSLWVDRKISETSP